MSILYDLLDVSIYALIGIILMIAGNFLIDLLIPCHFPTEIKKGKQAVGVIFLDIGYYLVSLFNRKYNLNDEIGNGNTAAGIMVAGIFIGIATIISGVIM